MGYVGDLLRGLNWPGVRTERETETDYAMSPSMFKGMTRIYGPGGSPVSPRNSPSKLTSRLGSSVPAAESAPLA